MADSKVLLVDDDNQILSFVSRQLRAQGYRVELARNGQEGLDHALEFVPDLVILDLFMPVMDGVETLRQLREWSKVPVIVLSARDEEQRKVEALDLGADDYLTKPFSVAELLARVRAALRRNQQNEQPLLQDAELHLGDDVEIDLRRRQVKRAGREIALTKTEYELLHCLASNAGKVVTHRQLLQEVWGPEYGEETEYLRTFIKQLRRKLEVDPSRPRLVVTQPGLGYRLAASV